MKLTATQLKQIIAEEIKKQKTLNEYGLGATMSSDSIKAAKAALDMARKEIEAQLAEEGYKETELEDFAADALTELFKEFMDEIGYGGRIDFSGL
jgi:hypothetical protein